MKIFDNKIYHDGEQVGWIEESHIRSRDNTRLGYLQGDYIYNNDGYKIAWIQENKLHFENGNSSIELQMINEEISGTVPLAMKCAVHVLLEG